MRGNFQELRGILFSILEIEPRKRRHFSPFNHYHMQMLCLGLEQPFYNHEVIEPKEDANTQSPAGKERRKEGRKGGRLAFFDAIC